MVCLEGLPQILLDPLLNTLTYLGHCQTSVLELFSGNSLQFLAIVSFPNKSPR